MSILMTTSSLAIASFNLGEDNLDTSKVSKINKRPRYHQADADYHHNTPPFKKRKFNDENSIDFSNQNSSKESSVETELFESEETSNLEKPISSSKIIDLTEDRDDQSQLSVKSQNITEVAHPNRKRKLSFSEPVRLENEIRISTPAISPNINPALASLENLIDLTDLPDNNIPKNTVPLPSFFQKFWRKIAALFIAKVRL